jgi:transcriptional regulator with XRE-family HTH domain
MDEEIILLGKRVKYLRRLRNLTQSQLAEKVDLSTNYISQIETGVATPTLKTLSMLAKVLGVQIKDLFDFDQLTNQM